MNHAILVIGCGSIGERHLRCFQRTGRAEVFACETRADLLQRITTQHGVTGFAGLPAALAARKYSGIVICTPAQTHLALALDGLGHDAGLLIEKPLDTRLDAVPAVREAVARAGKFVGVAFVFHLMPWIQEPRELLRGGGLGRPLQLSVVTGQHFPTYRPAYREIYYARHETGGGAIQDMLPHLVNAAEWLVGPATRVYCDARHQALEGVNVEDTVNLSAHHGDVLASYALNQFQAPNETMFQISCERGSVRIELHRQRWGVFRHDDGDWTWHPAPPLERDDLFVAQANAFLDGLEGRPTPLATLDEAEQTLRLCLAALDSSRDGKARELR